MDLEMRRNVNENEIEGLNRNKRESEMAPQPGEDGEPGKDIQDIFQNMFHAMVEGGKKIIQKVAEMIDSSPQSEQPPQQ